MAHISPVKLSAPRANDAHSAMPFGAASPLLFWKANNATSRGMTGLVRVCCQWCQSPSRPGALLYIFEIMSTNLFEPHARRWYVRLPCVRCANAELLQPQLYDRKKPLQSFATECNRPFYWVCPRFEQGPDSRGHYDRWRFDHSRCETENMWPCAFQGATQDGLVA